MPELTATVIIPAGGQGTRLGGERPKQYQPLAGRPVLAWTLERFIACPQIGRIVLVLRPEDMDYCRQHVLAGLAAATIGPMVAGGEQRWASVLAGLQATKEEEDIILVHDAVRPFVSGQVIADVVEGVCQYGAAVAAVPVKDTIKQALDGQVVQTPLRDQLWSAQTPQGFRRQLLLEAFVRRPQDRPITDEAQLVEALGHPVHLVQGDYRNLKITTPEDMEWAAWHAAREETAVPERLSRTGQGYDVHRLVPGRPLILGGIEIPHDRGLAGHSDADVLTHAVIDALLGALGAGDIGRLFPDTDARYKGISSLVLLGEVVSRLVAKSARIIHVDAVVMAQKPKLAPYIETMSRCLAQVLGVNPNRVSLKATTTEGLGFVGREEGIAAQAVAQVIY
ncbi:MAG: 2-C-methyl-D-erythritol 4-phosphate cytidylyltransferase [Candidatus Latescibacteria bacterium]|nr:2-C-methyl-D-erythritol 4-phosphate cytidylyltransferase [Candidatus Latescibacterota bacterium]